MSEKRQSTLSEKITAAATVATALAAAKTAEEAAKSRREMENMNAAMKSSAAKQEAIQLAMAAEQAESNFHNTVLATLPLLKGEDERVQFLTERLLPKLKEKIDTTELIERLTPIGVMSMGAIPILKNYMQNVAGQDLKDFFSVGKDLMERSEEWVEKCKEREKQIDDLNEAKQKLTRFTIMGIIKVYLWFMLFFILIPVGFYFIGLLPANPQDDEDTAAQQQEDDFYRNAVIVSLVLGVIIHLGLKWLKIKKIRAKLKSLPAPDNDPALSRDKEELRIKMALQDEKWEVYKPQIVAHFLEIQSFKNLITGDPHTELLKYATKVLEPTANDLESFLPPSSRLSARHYAQKLIDETNVQNFRDGQSTVEADLKTLLTPIYEKQMVFVRNEKPPMV
jgi:hypothetical protein